MKPAANPKVEWTAMVAPCASGGETEMTPEVREPESAVQVTA